jgi:hypothetical protein
MKASNEDGAHVEYISIGCNEIIKFFCNFGQRTWKLENKKSNKRM